MANVFAGNNFLREFFGGLWKKSQKLKPAKISWHTVIGHKLWGGALPFIARLRVFKNILATRYQSFHVTSPRIFVRKHELDPICLEISAGALLILLIQRLYAFSSLLIMNRDTTETRVKTWLESPIQTFGFIQR